MTLPINPETKVGALLDAYPGIDEFLISWVPAFSKLRNPILRKTVAKVATLEQAARIGGLSVKELVQKLREHTGQGGGEVTESSGAGDTGPAPEWVREGVVRHTVDAEAMIETGEHPIGKVRQITVGLQPGELLLLTSTFRPEPLIDATRRAGLHVYSAETSPGKHVTYFTAA